MSYVRYERADGSFGYKKVLTGESRVEQSHRDKCNINSIIARAKRTGLLQRRLDMPVYGDFTNATDYHDARNRLIEAENAFMSLPAAIRKRFDNDPAKLIDFVNNDDNIKEAVDLGLLPSSALLPVESIVESETPENPE